MSSKKLIVSSSPHFRMPTTTQQIMLDVLIALLPAVVAGAVIFGIRALLVVAVTVASCVLSELIFNIIVKKTQTVSDLSSAVTGVILGLNLHAAAPLWQCVIGGIFAIVVVKCLFGGIGCNFANPAATARVFLLVSFSASLGGGVVPGGSYIVTSATPLEAIEAGAELPSVLEMLIGMRAGAIGETCILALLAGFVYLVVRGVIKFETPLIFIVTVFLLSLVATNDFTYALYQVLSGGLMLGAVFMATDYSTTPLTRTGRMIFALGCGIITFLIRFFGTYPEGVSFAILIMNILAPYIEKWTANLPLGGKKA
ncbi:MAG: RnfABCDGE type electron transport complex subunit D [Clostridia bacterium]|nr:RnfABCDGE type electron transport complex subunit D [Clostridia bacterium]